MKKLTVNTPMCADRVIELLQQYDDEKIRFSFLEKKGMKLIYDVEGIDGDEAVSLVKKLIRNTDWGKSLYFYVAWE